MLNGVVRGDVKADLTPWNVRALDAEERRATDASGSWLLFSGQLFAGPSAAAPGGAATRLLAHLGAHGADGIDAFDGAFAVAWWDARGARLHLFRDRFGIEPLFVCESGGAVAFASRVRDLLASGIAPGGLCPQGLAEFLTYGWSPGDATLDRGIERVPPAGHLEIAPGLGVVARRRWWQLSFAGAHERDEVAIAERFRGLLERAVERRLVGVAGAAGAAGAGLRLGAFLSGGMDSSSIVSLARRHDPGAIHTFGFRCAGTGFDESVYARACAEALATEHHEVEYGEAQALSIERGVAQMDAPFCDIGINVGTLILGEAARGVADIVLTGDGGDEWWASHPVYAAQRLLALYERVPLPGAFDRALRRLAQQVGDSDRKRDLRVVLKRFLPPSGLPRALGPFRWRVYAMPGELQDLLTPEWAARVRGVDPFAPVLRSYDGYDGPDDGISPHLYADYTTASAFYFRRLGLLRHFGVEARSPFYDRELVEWGAHVAATKKLEGLERTKRLFRTAMQGVLPEVIGRRQDKLGHSVPMKLWLRERGALGARVRELIGPRGLGARGLVRAEPVARLLAEHESRRHNHSHRIWALYVLELWLRARESEAV